MRRLYSTFASGWPGLGLLLMRLVVGTSLVVGARSFSWSAGPTWPVLIATLLAGCGLLVIAGLWMPVVGLLVCLGELWRCSIGLGDPSTAILLATMSCSLGLLGPGLWSIDARLFGWKRIEVPPRNSNRHTS